MPKAKTENSEERNKRVGKKYRANNKDKLLESSKEYYRNNKEIILEKLKKQRKINKDEKLEKRRIQYSNDKDSITKKKREYYNKNSSSLNHHARINYNNHKENRRIGKQKQRWGIFWEVSILLREIEKEIIKIIPNKAERVKIRGSNKRSSKVYRLKYK